MTVQQHLKYLVQFAEDKILTQLQTINPNICCINYMYGSYKAIESELQIMAQDPNRTCQRYPVVMLIEDFPVIINTSYYDQVKMTLIIAIDTEMNYSSQDRQMLIYDQILNPIYEALINEIANSSFFMVYNPLKDMPHQKIDHKLWNKSSGKNEMGSFIDAIELKNLTLKLEMAACA